MKTIDQISTNRLLKKDSQHSYSKSSSQESSFKELMHLRNNRLSIDKSIYLQTGKELENFPYSVQDSFPESEENFTSRNIGLCDPLTPIKEERFSDKYSQINSSKIKCAISMPNGERLTLDSTSSEREGGWRRGESERGAFGR